MVVICQNQSWLSWLLINKIEKFNPALIDAKMIPMAESAQPAALQGYMQFNPAKLWVHGASMSHCTIHTHVAYACMTDLIRSSMTQKVKSVTLTQLPVREKPRMPKSLSCVTKSTSLIRICRKSQPPSRKQLLETQTSSKLVIWQLLASSASDLAIACKLHYKVCSKALIMIMNAQTFSTYIYMCVLSLSTISWACEHHKHLHPRHCQHCTYFVSW